MPGAFLSTAERFGLIQPIDRWVVKEAIALVERQRSAGRDVLVEVNLSGKSMEDPELPKLVEAELEATGIDPSALIFEITETMAIANLDKARELAERPDPRSAAASRSTTSASASPPSTTSSTCRSAT